MVIVDFFNNSMAKNTEIVVTKWAIWYAKNKLVHEGTNQGCGS